MNADGLIKTFKVFLQESNPNNSCFGTAFHFMEKKTLRFTLLKVFAVCLISSKNV